MIHSGLQVTTELLKLFGSRHRSSKVRYLLNHLRWLEVNDLPVEYFRRLFPEIAAIPASVGADIDHPFELPYGERFILAAIAAGRRPRLIFEFGTFSGSTTKVLADAAPEATVHTIDLPDEAIESDSWIADMIGAAFRDDPSYDGRIVQHRSNSRDFDYTSFHRRADLVYVDASHAHEDVVHDSKRALEIVSDDGVIVWDDYQPEIPGVVAGLRELDASGLDVVHVAETRLVVHRRDGFPHPVAPRDGRSWRRAPHRQPPTTM